MPGVRLDHRLQKTVPVDLQIGEFVQQPAPVIVIADQKVTRHPEPGQARLQITICLGLPVMDQVAGDDAELGVPVVPVDIIDAGIEAITRIKAM